MEKFSTQWHSPREIQKDTDLLYRLRENYREILKWMPPQIETSNEERRRDFPPADPLSDALERDRASRRPRGAPSQRDIINRAIVQLVRDGSFEQLGAKTNSERCALVLAKILEIDPKTDLRGRGFSQKTIEKRLKPFKDLLKKV